MNKLVILLLSVIVVLGVDSALKEVSANDSILPEWLKNVALYWGQGQITDQEYINGIQWMVDNGILKLNSDSGNIITNDSLNTDSRNTSDNDSYSVKSSSIKTEKKDNLNPELRLAYDSWSPEIKAYFDVWYLKFTGFWGTYEDWVHFDKWFPEFIEDYESWSPEAQKAFERLHEYDRKEIILNPELRAGFANWSPEFMKELKAQFAFTTKIESCVPTGDGLVKVGYYVYNANRDSYNLDYDILGVDSNGNTVTFGFLSIDNIGRNDEIYEIIMIDDHPMFDSCQIELVSFEKID